MQKPLLALALVSASFAFALPAAGSPTPAAFPSLTTIYVGTGVLDDGSADGGGTATTFQCSNVSGVSVQIRILILGPTGAVEGSATDTVAHGATLIRATHLTNLFSDLSLNTGEVRGGTVNIEATNAAVFCSGVVHNAAFSAAYDNAVPLRLVRVNPLAGTQE